MFVKKCCLFVDILTYNDAKQSGENFPVNQPLRLIARGEVVKNMDSFGYVFPAIRGVQAGREYYVSMCPLRLIPRIFLFDEEEIVPELRAQRTLNKNRVPEIARYILDNKSDYVFSALTASDRCQGSLRSGRSGRRRYSDGNPSCSDVREIHH